MVTILFSRITTVINEKFNTLFFVEDDSKLGKSLLFLKK